jgi:hypothetical protein
LDWFGALYAAPDDIYCTKQQKMPEMMETCKGKCEGGAQYFCTSDGQSCFFKVLLFDFFEFGSFQFSRLSPPAIGHVGWKPQ